MKPDLVPAKPDLGCRLLFLELVSEANRNRDAVNCGREELAHGRRLGSLFIDSKVENTDVNPQVIKVQRAIGRNEGERKRYEKLLTRVNAGLAIRSLEEKKRELLGVIDKLEKEIAANSKVRGNPDTLKLPEKR